MNGIVDKVTQNIEIKQKIHDDTSFFKPSYAAGTSIRLTR